MQNVDRNFFGLQSIVLRDGTFYVGRENIYVSIHFLKTNEPPYILRVDEPGAGLAIQLKPGFRFQGHDRFDNFHRALRKWQIIQIRAFQEVDLLVGRDPHRAVQPERIQAAGDILVAVSNRIDIILHVFSPERRAASW